MTAANNGKLQIEKAGDIETKIERHGKISDIEFRNVQHVPGICANLLSVSQIVKKGHEVIFNYHGCKVVNSDKDTIATGSLIDGMFKLDAPEYKTFFVENAKNIIPKKSDSDIRLWHRRLGHISYDNMKFLDVNMKNLTRLKSIKCETCIKGKQCRLPFPKKKGRELTIF